MFAATYACVKYWSPWITPITTEKRITGLIEGSVTQRRRQERTCAVERSGLVQVLRHIEDHREEDDHRRRRRPRAPSRTATASTSWVIEPERPVDPDMLERDVDRARRRVQQVDEAERGGDRRRERGGRRSFERSRLPASPERASAQPQTRTGRSAARTPRSSRACSSPPARPAGPSGTGSGSSQADPAGDDSRS